MNHNKTDTAAASLRVYADLQAALESGRGEHDWTLKWHVTLGAVSGLLIAKWAGCGEALGLPEGDEPAEQHARALLEALGEVSTRTAALRDLEPVRLPVMAAAATMPETYMAIIGWLRGIDLESSDGLQIAASAFDAAVRFAVHRSGRHSDWYITPSPVADLMLELARPKPGDKIYDPCFGSGELLLGTARRVGQALGSLSAHSTAQPASIFGVEINPAQYLIGLCRLLLAGVPIDGLEYGDALDGQLPDEHPTDGFDCIVTVPPWGRWPGGSESQFLRHVMERLRPDGRAVIAMSESTLFRSGSDQRARKDLLSEFSVEAVIALPGGVFAPYTSIPGNLVVFSRSEPRSTVCFASVSSLAWDAAAPEDGDADARGSVVGAPAADGAENVLSSSADLYRTMSRMVHQALGCPMDLGVLGVETWGVSLQELEQRRHELIVKKSGSDMLEAEFQRLAAAYATLKFQRLQRVAEVHAGLPYDRHVSTVRRTAPDVVAGLIRVGDVTDTEVRAPSLFFTGQTNAPVQERALLRSGDVVVTTSGTVGKVGFINGESASVGALASKSMVVIRTRPGVRPEFVAALLRSPVYQNWLSGHARGLVIQHLSIRALRTMTIPVPPKDVQDAVLRELGSPRADALAVLYRLLSGTTHPVMAWLEMPLAARLVAGVTDDHDSLRTLATIGGEIQSIVVAATSEVDSSTTDDLWLAIVRRAAGSLNNLLSIPKGSGRLAVLQFAAKRFHEAIKMLDLRSGSTSRRLRSVTETIVKLAEQEVHEILHTVHLDVDVNPKEVTVGIANEVRLRVFNAAAVPLFNIRVTAQHTDGTVNADEVVFLAENQSREIPLVIQPQDASQPFRIAVAWQALRIDSTMARAETIVSLWPRSRKDTIDPGDLGTSPYTVGNPVQRDMFFGRTGIMDQIRRQLGGKNQANVILLEGNRRTGKTSILKQLEKEDTLPGWVTVYCSFQNTDSMATRNVFRLLTLSTATALFKVGIETWIPNLPRPESDKPVKYAFQSALDGAFSDGHPYETLAYYLETAIEAARPRGVLLMIDEFDKLQEGIDNGTTSPQVPENLRHLLQHQPGIGAIITGSRRLKRSREEYWSALFGFGFRIGVSAIPEADAGRLVAEPVAGRLRYLPQARDGIVKLCACHPFLIQSLCSRVFDQAATGSDRTITLETVERAATEMVRGNEHFQTLWGYAGSERRRFILALCDRLAEGSDAVNIDLLRMKLDEYGVPVRRDRDLADDIAELRELEMLDLDESYRGGSYRLSIPLMARWLAINVAYDDLVVRARQEAEIS